MKYALLVHQSTEHFNRRDETTIAAGRAYGEALNAAGIFVAGAGFPRRPVPAAAAASRARPSPGGSRQRDDGYLRRALDRPCTALQIERGWSPDLRRPDTGS